MADDDDADKLAAAVDLLAAARRPVAFTGAGVSTESGIPDFRSPGGVWSQSQPVYFDDFLNDADARHEYWRQKSVADREFRDARPNVAHQTLARWEAAGRLTGVVTQNIDGLHQLAGSQVVWELHGSARRVKCLDCGADDDAAPHVDRFLADERVPDCPACGGRLKHATISFGQPLDPHVMQMAAQLLRQADLVLVLGSSLVVEPAASLPRLARQRGARLIIINRDETPLDHAAHVVLRSPLGATLAALDERLGWSPPVDPPPE